MGSPSGIPTVDRVVMELNVCWADRDPLQHGDVFSSFTLLVSIFLRMVER